MKWNAVLWFKDESIELKGAFQCDAKHMQGVSHVSVLATFPVRMLWLMKMSLGTGQAWGEKRSVLIFEGATPTFCFSILNKVFSESFPVCWFSCESQSCFSNSALWSSADFFPTSEESDLYLLSISLSFHLCVESCLCNIYIYPNTAMHATCDIFDPPPPLRTPSVCILCFRTSYTTFADIRDVYRDIPTNCELLDLHACIRLSVCLEPALSSSLPSIFGGSCSTRDWWAGLIWYEGCRSVGAGKSDN